jgi:hypothetical protein
VEKPFASLTFGEKVLHKMVHDKRPLLSAFADKASVKNRVAQAIGDKYIVPTYIVIEHESEINFAAYPREFVLKPTHGSQAGIIVSNKCDRLSTKLLPVFETWNRYFYLNSDDLDRNQGFVKIMARRWLNSYYRPETQYCYKQIPRKIIVEKYIEASPADTLIDFRFYTFHGEVKFFRTAAGYSNDLPTYAYDNNGFFLPVKAAHDEFDWVDHPLPELPREWILMKAFAELLSEGVDFVRVDFYLMGGNIYFSELTNYPQAGQIRFFPDSFDELVSSYWEKCDCCSTDN